MLQSLMLLVVFNSALVVIRNNAGEVLEAYTKCYIGTVLPQVAEAMRVREALSWTKEQQCSNRVIETSCLVVVQALCNSSRLVSYFGRIIDECRILTDELSNINVCILFIK